MPPLAIEHRFRDRVVTATIEGPGSVVFQRCGIRLFVDDSRRRMTDRGRIGPGEQATRHQRLDLLAIASRTAPRVSSTRYDGGYLGTASSAWMRLGALIPDLGGSSPVPRLGRPGDGAMTNRTARLRPAVASRPTQMIGTEVAGCSVAARCTHAETSTTLHDRACGRCAPELPTDCRWPSRRRVPQVGHEPGCARRDPARHGAWHRGRSRQARRTTRCGPDVPEARGQSLGVRRHVRGQAFHRRNRRDRATRPTLRSSRHHEGDRDGGGVAPLSPAVSR